MAAHNSSLPDEPESQARGRSHLRRELAREDRSLSVHRRTDHAVFDNAGSTEVYPVT